jgi:hypothetical protein
MRLDALGDVLKAGQAFGGPPVVHGIQHSLYRWLCSD